MTLKEAIESEIYEKDKEIFKLKNELEKQRKEYQETYKDVRIEIKEKDKKIERLNNIINEFEKWLDEKSNEYRFYDEHGKADTLDIASYKLEELKGDGSNE